VRPLAIPDTKMHRPTKFEVSSQAVFEKLRFKRIGL